MRSWGLIAIGMGGLLGKAEAAPWAQDAGGWYARALVSNEELDGAEGFRTDVYGEWGLRGRLTLTAKHEAVTYRETTNAYDRESYRITARHEVFRLNQWALGAEAGAVHGNVVAGIYGCQGWGGEGRLSLGRTGERQGRPYFVFSDLIYIQHEDGCVRRRAEVAYGTDLGRGVFTLQQAWFEQGNQTADSLKLESQIGYHFPLVDLSVGYREEIMGAFQESALLVALTARR